MNIIIRIILLNDFTTIEHSVLREVAVLNLDETILA